jgi:hypothetical protein
MGKETYYFSHDYNSRNDPKMVKVQMNMGLEGIGLYWCLIEMLYEQSGYLNLNEIESHAFALRAKPELLTRLINDFDLFSNDETKFWSESVLRRLQLRNEKSLKAQNSANSRWQIGKDANAMRTHSEGNAIKEKKVNNIKVKEKKINNNTPASPFEEIEMPFGEIFKNKWVQWKDYKKSEHRFNYKSIQSEKYSLASLLNKAENNEAKAIAIIQQSIENGWKGFFELKNTSNGSTGNNEQKGFNSKGSGLASLGADFCKEFSEYQGYGSGSMES